MVVLSALAQPLPVRLLDHLAHPGPQAAQHVLGVQELADQHHPDQRALQPLVRGEGQRVVQVDGRADDHQQRLRVAGEVRLEVGHARHDGGADGLELRADLGQPGPVGLQVDVLGHGVVTGVGIGAGFRVAIVARPR
jgi:hypothetical protein